MSSKSQVISGHYLIKPEKGVCPIRVVLSNQWSAEELLHQAYKLKRGAEAYRQVYLSPDRTPAELENYKKLATELKRKIAEEPMKR